MSGPERGRCWEVITGNTNFGVLPKHWHLPGQCRRQLMVSGMVWNLWQLDTIRHANMPFVKYCRIALRAADRKSNKTSEQTCLPPEAWFADDASESPGFSKTRIGKSFGASCYIKKSHRGDAVLCKQWQTKIFRPRQTSLRKNCPRTQEIQW